MALSSFIKNNTMGSITLTDGTPTTPLSITVDFEQGDFTISGLTPNGMREVAHYEVRGLWRSSARTSRIYPTGSFSIMFTEFSEATTGTLLDFILADGAYASRVSTLGSNYPVFTCDISITIEGTDYGDAADHTLTLEDCAIVVDSFSEGDPNTVSVSFTCLGDISGDLTLSQG